jgi:hypothetical protein
MPETSKFRSCICLRRFRLRPSKSLVYTLGDDSQLLHAMIERSAYEAKLPGGPVGTADYPANLFQSAQNQSTFGLSKSSWEGRSFCRLGGSSQRIWKHAILREHDRALGGDKTSMAPRSRHQGNQKDC